MVSRSQETHQIRWCVLWQSILDGINSDYIAGDGDGDGDGDGVVVARGGI
jgi:hypothetical protein